MPSLLTQSDPAPIYHPPFRSILKISSVFSELVTRYAGADALSDPTAANMITKDSGVAKRWEMLLHMRAAKKTAIPKKIACLSVNTGNKADLKNEYLKDIKLGIFIIFCTLWHWQPNPGR